MTIPFGCSSPPATKPAPKPERVYVRLAALEQAHPLSASLRELDAIAARLRQDTLSRPQQKAILSQQTLLAMPKIPLSDQKRNANARATLRQDADTTLQRYIQVLSMTEQRIRNEKRAELEGIAHARSAETEAQERAKIENATQALIFERAQPELDATIRRSAAANNLRDGNVISIARDPKTKLPSAEALEAQIVALRERDKLPAIPKPSPSPTSDEARLTKLLRDLEAELAKIRKANDRDIAINDGLVADKIADIRAENAIWVEKQLAALPNQELNRAELETMRTDLEALLRHLQQRDTSLPLFLNPLSPVSVRDSSRSFLPPALALSPRTGDIFQHIATERNSLRTTIRNDVAAAVQDISLTHNVQVVISPASNIPDRTNDFRQWIFGNVSAVPLSYHTTPR